MRILLFALSCALASPACTRTTAAPADHDAGAASATAPPPPAVRLSVTWTHENGAGGSDNLDSQLTIKNEGTVALGAAGWKLFFSMSGAILADGPVPDAGVSQDLAAQGLRCTHADAAKSGDYWVLEPLPSFAPLPPGGSRMVHMLASGSAILKTDAPAGFHLLLAGAPAPLAVHEAVRFDRTNPRETSRSPDDTVPMETPELRYAENHPLTPLPLTVERSLLPRPLSVKESGGRTAFGPGAVAIRAAVGLEAEAAYLKAALGDVLAGAVNVNKGGEGASPSVTLALNPNLDVTGDGAPDPEGFTLVVNDGGVRVVGADAAGVFYGVETLRQLVPAEVYRLAAEARARRAPSFEVPKVVIADAPLFHYRGMLLDVARHFVSKGAIEKLLDVLAAHKLNKFHFHLSDDEGWRLEIPGLPELTDYGARRGFDLDESRMLHVGFGSGSGLSEGDGIAGKPANETVANGGTAPKYQGFEEATLNFVGNGTGYYTARDFEEILVYAAERHIDVVPEFDVPAHARAAVRSMERRYASYHGTDEAKATQFRLVDPADTTVHTSVQGYADNLMNPCVNGTYAFLSKVVAEVKARYAAAHARLVMFHVGGDEPPGKVWWAGSPACERNSDTGALSDEAKKDYFFRKLSGIVGSAGVPMAGWDEVIQKGLVLDGFVSMPWNNVWGEGGEDRAYKEANLGNLVVLAHATNLYLDLAYNKDPDEPGGDWAGFVDEYKTFQYLPFDAFSIATRDLMGSPIAASTWASATHLLRQRKPKEPRSDGLLLSDTDFPNILGLEGLLWGENRKTPELLEYMAFPKILGVAERAWNRKTPTAQTLPAAWHEFVNTLGQAELPRLDGFRPVDVRHELSPETRAGINYRIPLPGASVAGGSSTPTFATQV